MKIKNAILALVALACSNSLFGQSQTVIIDEKVNKSSRFVMGYNLNQFQNDFGIGLNLRSPYFLFNHNVALRASGNLQWLQSISGTTQTSEWNAYQTYKLGVTGITTSITKTISLYGEGGLVALLPNGKFSDKSVALGGYGLFGFEFNINKKFCYFLELGGIGSGAVAEKSIYKPVYSNGFTTSVGFRISL